MEDKKLVSFDELEQFYESLPAFTDKYKRIEDYEELLDEIEDLEDEILDLRNEVQDLEREMKNFWDFQIRTLHDELKLSILHKAFQKYSLDELENKLNMDWL